MPTPSNIQTVVHAGHACLQLHTRHGTATVALHGAQLLSWVPKDQQEVLWLSPTSPPEPAAIRGGVPICWPWFSKQDMPLGAMQHGPVRNLQWDLDTVYTDSADQVSIKLIPSKHLAANAPLQTFAPHLRVALTITLGDSLVQTLETHNLGPQAFALTQALHSYFAVQDVTQVQLQGLANLYYEDKLLGVPGRAPTSPWQLDVACDRIYQHAAPALSHYDYTLDDPIARRYIHLRTQGSQSVVVWNPGANQARNMADVPDAAWRNFLCIEASNAGQDIVLLAPGAQHRLTQSLTVQSYASQPLTVP